MNDLETCREQILSEDTRDFISNPLRTPLFNELLKKDPCIQDAGLGYQCIYFSKELVEPISLTRFSYNSIPNCFAPVAMETLNQTGILPVQNYPALQLKGKGVLIGFLDSGIDYQNNVFRTLDGTDADRGDLGSDCAKRNSTLRVSPTEVHTVRTQIDLKRSRLENPHCHRSLLSTIDRPRHLCRQPRCRRRRRRGTVPGSRPGSFSSLLSN